MHNKEIKIAVVDDHQLVRECLSSCLNLWGYSVVLEACNGKAFIEKIAVDNLPDICILDLNMPVLDGYDTIPIVKKAWPSIKILVFSMNITKGMPSTILEADSVISKSDGLTEIKGALQRLCSLIASPQKEVTKSQAKI